MNRKTAPKVKDGRINTKSRSMPANGEKYAESYAYKYEKIIWNKYFDAFDG